MKKKLLLLAFVLFMLFGMLCACQSAEFKITKDLYVLEVGEENAIQYVYGGKKKVKLVSANEAIVTTEGTTIKGVAVGSATVSVTAGGNELKVSVEVTAPIATGMTIPAPQSSYHVNQTVIFKPVITPLWVSQEVTWVSSDANIITIADDGTAVMKSEGVVTLTATSVVTQSISARITVRVEQPLPTSVSITGAQTATVEENLVYVWDIAPDDAIQGVNWTVSDSPKALTSLDSQGNLLITYAEEGTSVITATTKADPTVSASITVTVSKADACVVMEGAKYTYDGSPKSLEALATHEIPAAFEQKIAFSYYIDGVLSSTWPTDTGTYAVKVIGSSAGYYGEAEATLVIEKAVISYPVVRENHRYNGKLQSADILASALYTLSGNKETHVGDYVAHAELNDPDNYEFSNVSTLNWSILPAEVTISADPATSVYGEELASLSATVAGVISGEELAYTLSCPVTEGANAGSYPIKVMLGSNPDYDITSTDNFYTVTKLPVEVSLADGSFTYDGASHSLSLSGEIPSGVTAIWKANVQSLVGKYQVTVAFKDYTGNYQVPETLSATLTIAKKAATIIANNVSSVYGEESPALTARVTGVIAGDELAYTLDCGADRSAGRHEVKVILGDNPNYKVTVASGIYTIFKATYDMSGVTFTDKEVTYDGKEHLLEISGALPKGITVSYTDNQFSEPGKYKITASFTGDRLNYNTIPDLVATLAIGKITIIAPQPSATYVYDGTKKTYPYTSTADYKILGSNATNAGTHEVTASLLDSLHYQWNSGSSDDLTLTWVITKAQATITANDATSVYGEELALLSATVAGVISGDELAYTLSTTAQGGGTAKIVIKLGDNPNYNIKTVNGTYTVTRKNVFVNVDSCTKAVGADDPVFTATVSGLVGTDELKLSFIRESGEEAGSYVIYATAEASANYTIYIASGTLTIA